MNYNLPKISNINDFCREVGVSTSYVYSIYKNGTKNFYRSFVIKKRSGEKRQINAPLPTINLILKWIQEEILEKQKVSKYAKAYTKNLSIKDNARFHRNQKTVLKIDIVNFFDNIHHASVFKLFKSMGYNKFAATLLANLTTLNDSSIPQGAPTSPIISNLILYNFDETLGKSLTKQGLRFTRYADDITISGNFDKLFAKKLILNIQKELHKQGFLINYKKIQILSKSQRQQVTGISVNHVLNVNKKYRHNLRLEVYHYLSNHSRQHLERVFQTSPSQEQELFYIRQLIGKINYLLYINPNNKDYFDNALCILKEKHTSLMKTYDK